MAKKQITFEFIKQASEELGASVWAIQKWRQRGVPQEWRIKIVQANPGVVYFEDFDRIKAETMRRAK